MTKLKNNVKTNVVSIRVSDNEMIKYKEIIKHKQINMSRLMREAIVLYKLHALSVNIDSKLSHGI